MLAVGAEAPRRVEVLLAHEPVHRGGDHGLAVDQSLPAEALGRHEAGRDGPDGRIDGCGGDGHLVRGAQLGIEVEAELVGDHPHRLPNPAPSASAMMLVRDSAGVLPNSIQSRMTSGAP